MSEVFISYRRTNDQLCQRVRLFAERLRAAGITVILDQFFDDDNPAGPIDRWAKWSADRAFGTKFVVIIGTYPWFQCFDGKQSPGTGLGAAYEAGIIRQRIYEGGGVNEFIRVVVFDDAEAANIPAELRGYQHFRADQDFERIIRWLGGTRPEEHTGGAEHFHSLSISSQSDNISILRKEDNPFQTAGMLPPDHRTYIRRGIDDEFERSVSRADRLISISGVYLIGKSSLMQQARRLLTDHHFIDRGLADLCGHDASKFMKNFFGLFAERFGSISDWDELEDHVSQCPSVLFLDEVGEVASAGLCALIPGLVARLTQREINLRVIATSSQPLQTVFAARGLDNPKYSKPWTRIFIGTCNYAEASELLGMLPSRSRSIAIGHLDLVERISGFAPQRLQCLCYRLFDGECDGLSDRELSTIIEDSASYQ